MSKFGSSQHEREIGRVVSVTTVSVKIELNADDKSSVRSYPGGLSTVAQIGAYLLFPIGAGEHTVGVLTGAFENEGYEPSPSVGMSLQLVKPRRVLSANLLGTLEGSGKFLRGITAYPTLETIALIPDQKQLIAILSEISPNSESSAVEIVRIGHSPIYERVAIGLSIDDLFSRPLAIVGNTGSGKSWTVASLIQNSIATVAKGKESLAKFIILDINGEYSKAFGVAEYAREVNAAYISGLEFSLPMWLFELQAFTKFFGATAATQVPILERVITSIREDAYDSMKIKTGGLDKNPKVIRMMLRNVEYAREYVRKLRNIANATDGNWMGTKARASFENVISIKKKWGADLERKYILLDEAQRNRVQELGEALNSSNLMKYSQNPTPKEVKDPYDSLPPDLKFKVAEFADTLEPLFDVLYESISLDAGLPTITADTPIPFDPNRLDQSDPFELAIAGMRGEERIKEYISTLRLRIRRILQDKRWGVFRNDWDQDLEAIINRLTGSIATESNVIVVDCSMLAYDVLPIFCATIGRLLLEIRENSAQTDRVNQPWVLVLEEAHNYLRPRREGEEMGTALSRDSFERISKEGRKFGLSLIVASQRPSEVSDTVLSQCANFIVHRIQNPTDIDYFKKILPSGSREILDQVSILVPGEALLIGSATNVPSRVKVRAPGPPPASKTPEPATAWKSGAIKFNIAKSIHNWLSTGDAASSKPLGDNPLLRSESPKNS